MAANRTGKKSKSPGGRSKGRNAAATRPLVSPTVQWVIFAGLLALVIAALLISGIGGGSSGPGGGGHGLGVELQAH